MDQPLLGDVSLLLLPQVLEVLHERGPEGEEVFGRGLRVCFRSPLEIAVSRLQASPNKKENYGNAHLRILKNKSDSTPRKCVHLERADVRQLLLGCENKEERLNPLINPRSILQANFTSVEESLHVVLERYDFRGASFSRNDHVRLFLQLCHRKIGQSDLN